MFFTASNMATGSVNNACLRSLICLYETSIGQFVYQALTPNQNMVHIPDAPTSKTNGMYTNLHIANSTLVTASATAPRCDRLPIIPRNSKQENRIITACVSESAEMENEANLSI